MEGLYENYVSYTWHQSHDQATVVLFVPYDSLEDDIAVIIDRNHLVAGLRGQPPVVKGRLYGNVDVTNSMWQLERHRGTHISARERTISTTSAASSQSSFAYVSDPEISSSFAASLDNTDLEDPDLLSPALSSPRSSAADELNGFPIHPRPRHRGRTPISHPVSPHIMNASLSHVSSYSSMESLHSGSDRLLTIHLEKADSVIWPSLIVGPAPESLAPCNFSIYPWASSALASRELRYNMDPTSLVLLGLELSDIRDAKEEAFEYFIRAWHQAHVPSATIRLSAHYVPTTAFLPENLANVPDTPSTPTSDTHSPGTTPTVSHASMPHQPHILIPGTTLYYLHYIGGPQYLARLYLETGLHHLEGTAGNLLTSSSSASLSSLRTSAPTSYSRTYGQDYNQSSLSGTYAFEAWKRDQDNARRYFDRARVLCPELDVPPLPQSDPPSDTELGKSPKSEDGESSLKMPIIDLHQSTETEKVRRRRRKEEDKARDAETKSASAVKERTSIGDEDNTWYLYLPGLVGAGTALLVVGFLSFSSWRKGQGS